LTRSPTETIVEADLTLLLLVSLSFGLLVTAEVVLVVRLVREGPLWRALVALLLPPLAAYWGFRGQSRAWASIWVGAFAAYLLLLFQAGQG
jgi:hypothetical protein